MAEYKNAMNEQTEYMLSMIAAVQGLGPARQNAKSFSRILDTEVKRQEIELPEHKAQVVHTVESYDTKGYSAAGKAAMAEILQSLKNI